MLTSVPNLRLEDECFGALVPKFGCLSEMCMKGMAGTEDPEKLDYASSGCGLDKIADRMCDPLCMTPMTAMDGGDCLVVVSERARECACVCARICAAVNAATVSSRMRAENWRGELTEQCVCAHA